MVKALVEVIDSDNSIRAEQEFYVCEDGSVLTGTQICTAAHLCLQAFLLGVWHYIIANVQDNKVGADTYNERLSKIPVGTTVQGQRLYH